MTDRALLAISNAFQTEVASVLEYPSGRSALPPSPSCSTVAAHSQRFSNTLSHLKLRIVILRPDLPDVGEPVAVVVFGRALQRVDQRPGLTLVGPVVGLEVVRLPEERARLGLAAGAMQVLAELEVRGSERHLLGP